ncbi:MAG: translation initiation factor IF-2 [Candidatus Gracilibacteria bacterium]|nr:translation initiation factor IF-2 [Candidatus Gracilibacteria bacterium]
MPYGIKEIADEFKISEDVVRGRLNEMGFEIAGKASTLSDEMVDSLRNEEQRKKAKSAPRVLKPEKAEVKVVRKEELGTEGKVILVKKADVAKKEQQKDKDKTKAKKEVKKPKEDSEKEAESTKSKESSKKKPSKTETKEAPKIIRRQINTPEELKREDSKREEEEERALKKILEEKSKKAGRKNITKLNFRKDDETEITEKEDLKKEIKKISLSEITVVKDLAEKMELPVTNVIAELLRNGVITTLNDKLDFETSTIIANELGFEVEKSQEEEKENQQADLDLSALIGKEDKKQLVDRAPIISVIGHVDHGKTKLLDCIRGTEVAEGEAGGITQKIGAYQVEKKGKKITFLDTPGHEAFTAMRARGVKSTDIAILVVAADDGVMPQTIEAINHAKAANIPIVVAINKIDKDGANPDKIKKELAEHGVLVEGWGGDTVCALISAKEKTGIDDLLEMVLLVADMQALKANPNRPAVGTVIESNLDQNLGPVATILVHTGTLKLTDNLVIGVTYGKIRQLIDYKGKSIKEAGPSVPVRISGLASVPKAGDLVYVVANAKLAKEMSERINEERVLAGRKERFGLNEATKQVKEGIIRELNIILKADSKGSIEAIKSSLAKIPSGKVSVRTLHSAAGDVTDSDVMMASASHAIIVSFTTKVPLAVQKRAEIAGVEIKRYDVIYKLIEDIEKALLGLLEPEKIEVALGDFSVLAIFFTGKGEQVVGGKVTEGHLEPGSKVRVYREEEMVGEGLLTDLKQGPESVKQIEKGTECGIRFKADFKLKEGDDLEVFKVEQQAISLE